tara:strand:+ start:75 stop:515 length:441 start_codon:yes stop_codon:yes gene_type:complete
MKEKSKFAQAAKTVMNAVNSAVTAVQLSMEADSPSQVYEVHFKLKKSYLKDTYRVVLDPNYMGDNSYFVYKGDGFFAELMGFAHVQKNGKGFVVSQWWFGKKNTITFNDENTELVDVICYDANTPEAYEKIEEEGIAALKAENLPF